MKYAVTLFLLFTLSGCFGEDYDVGVPTASLYLKVKSAPLTEANVSWESSTKDVHRTVEDIEKYGSSLDVIKISPNQKVALDFKENKNNGGDIWTDPKITVALIKGDERMELPLHSQEFQFPTEKGSYILEVEFVNSAGSAQYVGNIVIQ